MKRTVGTKCMEQNVYLFAFFNCDNTNLTKNDKKECVLHKVNGAMFEKSVFSQSRECS